MKKNIVTLLKLIIGIVIVLSVVIGTNSLIEFFEENNQISKLEKYDISNQQFYEFSYDKKSYALSSIVREDSLSRVGIFYKKNETYYLMEQINQCDFSDTMFYVDKNKIYIHCFSNPDGIFKYEIINNKLQKKLYTLNFENVSNISKLHLQFDRVTNNYVYLYSVVKNNDLIKEGNRIKCVLKNDISFKDNTCEYDDGYINYNEETIISSKLIYEEISPIQKENEIFYKIRIYQNENNVIVVVTSNSEFGNIEYTIKSNKKINKDDIKTQWTSNGNLYASKDDKITGVTITILDKNNQYNNYSSRLVNFEDKSVEILSNNIIK